MSKKNPPHRQPKKANAVGADQAADEQLLEGGYHVDGPESTGIPEQKTRQADLARTKPTCKKEQAKKLAEAGLCVLPLLERKKEPFQKGGYKNASIDLMKIDEWWTEHPNANIGIATGPEFSRIVVIDIDVDEEAGKNGLVFLRKWEEEHGSLPETQCVKTGSGGCHRLYRTDKPIKSSVCREKSIDIRGVGTYVVAPPSEHPNGNLYEWDPPFDPNHIAEADDKVLDFINWVQEKPARSKHRGATQQIRKGERNNRLTSYLGTLQYLGLDDEEIRERSKRFNQERMEEPLPDDEVQRTCESILSYEKGPDTSSPKNPFEDIKRRLGNDKEMSRVFAAWLQGKAVYVPEHQEWKVWDGSKWAADQGGQLIQKKAKEFADELSSRIRLQMIDMDEDASEDKLLKLRKKYDSHRKRKELIEDTKCEVPRKAESFDENKSLLNVLNGTLDLTTYEFSEKHDPMDYCSKIANVTYDPEASSSEWDRFLDEVLQHDAETKRTLQIALGQSLIGRASESMVMLLGKTRSGKSTVVDTIQKMLNPGGDGYACSCNPGSLMVKRFEDASKPSGDIARLAGKRYVVVSEPPKGMAFDAALLKRLTGGDSVVARPLYGNDMQFYAEFTLFMVANDPPKINDLSVFSSDRIQIIPFERHLSREERDCGLKDRLTKPASLSGILNWCIEGLRLYREKGFVPSKACIDATEMYREESDVVGNFLSECLEDAKRDGIKGNEAYAAYRMWCQDRGHQVEGKHSFFADLRRRNLMEKSGTINGKTERNVILRKVLAESARP